MTADEAYEIDPNAPPPPQFYPALYRKLRILKWLALVGGIVMLGGGTYEYMQAVKLQTSGEQTVGKLFDKTTLATGKGRTSYQVILDYKPPDDATTYRKPFVVSKELFDQIAQQGEATVTYLPDSPETSSVGGQTRINTEPLAIGGGLVLVSAVVWWYQRREWKKIHAYITGG